MSEIVPAEKSHIPIIVAISNNGNHDTAIYHKGKVNTTEIEAELHRWYVVKDNNSKIIASIKVLTLDFISRKLRYRVLFGSKPDLQVLKICCKYMFDKFNLNKIVTDIIYDRKDILKDFISLGGTIEVRKRNHLFTSGKYHHVVEVAILKKEFKA